jgi:hypothetical protein
MTDEHNGDQSVNNPPAPAPPTETPQVNSAPASQIEAEEHLADAEDEIEGRMSAFERASLRWSIAMFAVTLGTGIFIGLQWYEIKTGSADTHELAVQAKNQADRTKDIADRALTQAQATNQLAIQAKRQADIASESLVATQRAFITFDHIGVERTTNRTPQGDVSGFEFLAIMPNDGNTPASDVISTIIVVAQDKEPTDQDLLRISDRRAYIEGFVGPKRTLAVGKAQHSDTYLFGAPLPTIHLETTVPLPKSIYLYGWAVYRDIFPNTKVHLTEFCLQLEGVGTHLPTTPGGDIVYNLPMAACHTHDCTDEYCTNYKQMVAFYLNK